MLENAEKLHIIGIGGSGTYPMVQIFHKWGYKISGSDNNPGSTIDSERAMGVLVTIGHSEENITKDIDAVIYSAAIQPENVEIVKAKEMGIPVIPRSKALRFITEKYSNTIGVSGTHGKTSTTAMLTQILLDAEMDPTAVIGGRLPAIDGYGRAGDSDVMVVEACEYKDTYRDLAVDVGVILNIDEDHLEYFGNLDNIISSFREYAKGCTKAVIVNGDDENTMKAVKGIDKEIITFGFEDTNNYYPKNIKQLSPIKTQFDLYGNGVKLEALTVGVPGKHNLSNALASCAAALYVGTKPAKLKQGLNDYKGAGRRFEMLGKVNGIQIADDYAHHPKEIEATLKVAKTLGYNDVWAVFQPFTYSRTALLLDDFAKSLKLADHVVMSKIMGGRETNTYNIYTKDLGVKIPNAVWFDEFPEICEYVMTHAKSGDLVITLGCGDVYKCANMMINYKK